MTEMSTIRLTINLEFVFFLMISEYDVVLQWANNDPHSFSVWSNTNSNWLYGNFNFLYSMIDQDSFITVFRTVSDTEFLAKAYIDYVGEAASFDQEMQIGLSL